MEVISIPNLDLSKKIAEFFKCKVKVPVCKQFKDGEPYLCLKDNFENKNVAVVQFLRTPVSENLINLFLLLDALKKEKPKNIVLVLPFCVFRRQNKITKKGEGIPLQMFFRLLKNFPIKKIITVDLHSAKFLPSIVHNIKTSDFFSKYFVNKKIDLVLSPDKGSMNRCILLAKSLNAELNYMEKKREGYEINLLQKDYESFKKYHSVLIYDDEIDTGSTILKSMEVMPKNAKIYVAATHGVFSQINKKIFRKAVGVCVTNSIPQDLLLPNLKIVSIHEIICDYIKNELKLT